MVHFAAILEDGSVCGGDSSAVQDQLKSVRQVQATSVAFAAILEDGSVVTWGGPGRGGDSSAVQDQLKSVRQVQATSGAFAAILEDGSVVTWGDPDRGGDSSGGQDRLKCCGRSGHRLCICCHLGRWLCRRVGSPRLGQ